MPFSVKDWKDYPDTSTPITQAALEDMETRLSTYTTQRTEISVSEFGAVGNGTADDTAALQAAIDAAASSGATEDGATVFLPPGTYRFTTALSIPPGVSMRGCGRSSVLKPYGCDGLAFQTAQTVGPQRFEQFYILGAGGYTETAVKALGDADYGQVVGVTFMDVLITNVKTAFHLRSTKNWRISHVTVYDAWEGVRVVGQSILLSIDGGSSFYKRNATGTGSSYGMLIDSAFDYNPGGNTERPPEGIRVTNTEFFGFDYGVDHQRGLDSKFSHMTLGGSGHTGFRYYTADGGITLRDSWITLGTDGLYGIWAQDFGVDDPTKTAVFDNVFVRSEGAVLDADSIGCRIEGYQNVTVRNCSFRDFKLHDIRLNWAGRCQLIDNNCQSTDPSVSIQLVAIGGGGPYTVERNRVAGVVQAHQDNDDRIVASAATITLPPVYDLVTVTGTTTITTINVDYADRYGRVVTLLFDSTADSTAGLTDGSNLKLAGNFSATAGDTITLVCNGDDWIEIARSVN